MKKILCKFLLFFISFFVCVILVLILTNYFLKFTKIGKDPEFLGWTTDAIDYTPRYVFWGKSGCEKNKACKKPIDNLLTQPQTTFNPSNENFQYQPSCQKILFLGDSYTDTPFVNSPQKYPDLFSQAYADSHEACVTEYVIAVPGAGDDQEMARFVDVIEQLQPNLVVWEFCWNDFYDNINQGVYQAKNQTVFRRMAYRNPRFIAGFLNQNVPFLKHTTLGNELIYLGEREDPFHWNETTDKSIIAFNETKIPLLIQVAKNLSTQYHFQLSTTLAPLQCQMLDYKNCPYVYIQDKLRNILKKNSSFISMEQNEINLSSTSSSSSTSDPNLFAGSIDKGEDGVHHLSEQGNKFFTQILFNNYQNQESNK